MKQILLVCAVVMGQPVLAADEKLISDPIVEQAIRREIRKPTGKLTKADLGNVFDLNLSQTQITDASLREVAKLKQLIILKLGATKITNAGLKEVAKLKQLGALYLPYTKITDAGLKEVAKMKQLKTLILLGTKVTEAGVAELRKALPKCRIGGP